MSQRQTGDRDNAENELLVVAMLGRFFQPVRGSYLLKVAIALALVLIVVGLLGVGIFVQTSETLDSNVERTVLNQATLEADEMTDWIKSNERPARLVSADSIFREGDTDEIEAYLQTVREERLQESSYGLDYVNFRNKTVVASAGEPTGQRTPWYSRVQFASVDDVFISAPYTTADGTDVIAFISQINDVPEHLLVLRVPVEDREETTQSFDGSFTTVVDSTETVILSSGDGEPLNPYLADQNSTSAVVRSGVVGETGFREEHAKNADLDRRVVVGYAPVAGTDWTVIKHVPAEEAYQIQTTVQWGLVLLLAGSLLGLVLFGATIGHRTVVAIRTLSRKAAAIERGEYETPVESGRSDEIGSLYESIDGMRDELIRQIHRAESARETAEQNNEQLQVVDRMLRHNIYNQLTIVKLNAERAEATSSGEVSDQLRTILETIDDIIEKVDKQRLMTISLARDTHPESVNLGMDLSALCGRLETKYPSADIAYDGPESLDVVALPRFNEAIVELVENGICHNDQDTPGVVVDVIEHEETVQIRIEDDGPGIPDRERDLVVGDEDSDQLNHSSGVGLWMVTWLVRQSGGTITIEEREPRGSVVKITLQKPGSTVGYQHEYQPAEMTPGELQRPDSPE